jgi:DNA mismatch endonuclease (patch repair protein)
MSDPLSPEHRSWLMSRIRSEDTKPEWVLRSGLHRLGFRFRLRDKAIPGRPDLVLPKYGAVVFVHGCFWHQHRRCRAASVPKSNTAFWEEKFARNLARDRRNRRELRKLGWRVLVVWECELMKETVATIEKVADWLRDEDQEKRGKNPPRTARLKTKPIKKQGAKSPTKAKIRKAAAKTRYDDSPLDRRTLISVAEEKVEYRLAKGRPRPTSG